MIVQPSALIQRKSSAFWFGAGRICGILPGSSLIPGLREKCFINAFTVLGTVLASSMTATSLGATHATLLSIPNLNFAVRSSPKAISGDGSIVVGQAVTGGQQVGAFWRGQGAPTLLPSTFIATGVSEDGTAIRPYNQIATEMIAGSGDSTVNGAVNFTVLGFVPMGPAQDTMDGQAVLTSTVFLGLSSMDCLLCHDGAGHLDAVNLWGSTVTRPQAWGMSAFYARTRRTFARPSTDVNYGVYTIGEGTTGEYTLNTNSGNRQTRAPIGTQSSAAPKYLFGTTTIGTSENRRQALARLMTADPQFARAAVNYIWEEMMVEALVSPSNTFDLARLDPNAKLPGGWTPQPNNPELLEALARDFMQNGFNLKRLIGQIAKSSTYQLSSSYPGTWKLDYVPYYARKYARRLDAEEIHDAIVQATGLPPLSQYREAGSTTGVNVFGFPILSDEGKLRRVVRWAGQLPDPAEPRTNFTARAFLDSFLRGNRDANLRSDDSSILQSLNLMNNTTITQRIRLDDRVTIGTETIRNTVYNLVNDRTLTDEKVIERLYLLTLSRYPTAAEKSKLLPFFNWTPRQQAVESLQWVLLNKVDFIFNY